IEDTGIGIAEEDLPRVFERGFTGYTGRIDKKATGIGLFLCKQILDRLSHTITIESQVGEGTKVKIGLDVIDIDKE
ncbi:MAG: ATP-binding protein, partial [Bacillota bacterium]